MTTREGSFQAILILIWLRLIVLATLLAFFCLMAWLPRNIRGWSFYLGTWEVLFEVAVRAVFVACGAVGLGTIFTALSAPLLLYSRSFRRRAAEVVTEAAIAVTAFGCIGFALKTLLNTLIGLADLSWFPMRFVLGSYCVAFIILLLVLVPRRRKQIVRSLDGILGPTVTKRATMSIFAAVLTLVAGEWTAGAGTSATEVAARAPVGAGPNIVLVTFDALSAEDMSLYGYRLPTTPNIDKFAGKSSVFTNFYSASTFTTPSVATILSGLAPSENHVYHLDGSLGRSNAGSTLPHLMRNGGYSTSASVGNPAAYYLAEGVADGFDFLGQPKHRPDRFVEFWQATTFLHQHEPFGSRLREYWDLEGVWAPLNAVFARHHASGTGTPEYLYPAEASFAQAREVLSNVPDGFFLWVHLFAPHAPYLPDPPFLGRYLPAGEVAFQSEWHTSRYPSSEQKFIDKARLRYDELITQADAAFGAFLFQMERDGRLKNTAVILAADHGESFEGGLAGHDTEYQTRPEIHIPLIIRMPGQEQGRRVHYTADQTALAPTLLDIAGVRRADSMKGSSLVPWLNRDGEGEGQGLAFTEYLATDSIFKPLNRGTIGVIDGRHQYILDLGSGKAKLRRLAEAQLCDLDRSAEDPALAQTMREAIYARFPDLPRRSQ